MTFRECINLLKGANIPNPEYDARELFINFAPLSRGAAILDSTESDSAALVSAVERRCAREPLQYIIGEVGFYRELYSVSPDCLIPRADTEILVDFAVKISGRAQDFLTFAPAAAALQSRR